MNALFDLQYALRRLSKAPGFTAMAVLVLAVGLGLSVYIYTFLKVAFYEELDFPGADRLVFIEREVNQQKWCCSTVSPFTYQYLQENQSSFEEFGALRLFSWVNFSDGNNAARPWSAFVTSSLFKTLQVEPLLGRTLQPQDDRPGADKVAVIGYQLWQDVYAGRGDVIGTVARIHGEPHSIVGVMPEGFSFPVRHELWLPLQLEYQAQPVAGEGLTLFGRLDSEATLESGNVEIKSLMQQLSQDHPDFYGNTSASAWPASRLFFASAEVLIFLMTSAAVAILLLVCFNVGNLLLARANENIREVAIRSALGAPRFRLMRQTLTESLLLSIAGGVVGLFLAHLGLSITQPVMETLFGFPAPFWWQFELRAGGVGVAVVAVLVTWLLAGLLPAWRASGVNCNAVLKDGNKGGVSKGNNRLTSVLVYLQIALSSVFVSLAIGWVVMLVDLMETDYGINPENYITGHIILPLSDYPDHRSRTEYFDELTRQLVTEPGIVDASAASALVGARTPPQPYTLADRDLDSSEGYPTKSVIAVAENYFDVMDVALLEGRGFNRDDTMDSRQVVIIDQQFAEKMWPDEAAVGKRIQLEPKTNGEWLTVVGVLSHIVQTPAFGGGNEQTAFYRPFSQDIPLSGVIPMIAKVEGDPASYDQAVRNAVMKTDSLVPVDALWTLQHRLSQQFNGFTLFTQLFGIFGVLALLLAACGIYSITSRAIVLRTHELGIRRALGASNRSVVRLLLWQGTKQLMVGLTVGLLLSVMLALKTTVGDTVDTANVLLDTLQVFAAVAVILGIVVYTASYLPARRAVALEPSAALHYE